MRSVRGVGPRRLKPPKSRKLFRPKQVPKPPSVRSVWYLTKTATYMLWRYRKLFLGIALVYGILDLLLVRGFSTGTNIGNIKQSIHQVYSGNFSFLLSGLTAFVALVGSSAGGGTSGAAGAYQLFLVLITSLASIWSLRQVFAGTNVRIRDAYYQGIYPLVPFMLVLVVIGIQLVPLAIGAALYSAVITGGIAALAIEKILWFIGFLSLASISFYFIISSVFALYIVTLPNMTPLKALRSARELVRYRRWVVLRKLLFLPLLLIVVGVIVMLPIIGFLAPLAPWVFFVLTMLAVVAQHGYLYTLYRELLNE